jgi:hypothetical protein
LLVLRKPLEEYGFQEIRFQVIHRTGDRLATRRFCKGNKFYLDNKKEERGRDGLDRIRGGPPEEEISFFYRDGKGGKRERKSI